MPTAKRQASDHKCPSAAAVSGRAGTKAFGEGDIETPSATSSSAWGFYDGKLILAPMVHMNTLPFRSLCFEYGAQICYSEEILDFRIQHCTRKINHRLKTVDFCYNGTMEDYGIHGNHLQKSKYSEDLICFRTIPGEEVVFQIGSNDPVSALRGAEVICRDVKAIDLNCGCPKPFSVDRGYGAALIQKPDSIKDIIATLSRNVNIPVTAKIRLHDSRFGTQALCKAVESGGGSAVAVHARFTEDRPTTAAAPQALLTSTNGLSIPVIYNGDIFSPKDVKKYKSKSGANSVMLARGPMWNASIFRVCGNNFSNPGKNEHERKGEPLDMLPPYEVAKAYLEKCISFENGLDNTKKNILSMMSFRKLMGAKGVREQAESAKSFQDLKNTIDQWATGRKRFDEMTSSRGKRTGNKPSSQTTTKIFRAPMKLHYRKFEWKK
mmetsp:Transcript_18822/g.46155  ORF Transcript_18822/g.46155 Transcript_18822/m.46155 type:complete len:436 (-) Transcript_18822:214-1521(-)